ncbi:hypothetical protein SAMN05421810_101798 [Amycolatopsis arida]|uniref:Uncharacterized protein n=1 Tax=Amycolatopsis arida TaxID=587909 RepID=A0A1I5M5R7_9PSEU|nr:hypothetical protein [Amycolatopsis arida]TDX93973.1 hypothetical protein CLV69_104430 [Amycolatopsis arida]SFP04667.1 hypothetical protein SAMN05421810_101798 [Amycolatopsis arida]
MEHQEPERVERFTDEELAFLRFARFGELPPRVLPQEMAEVTETERPDLPGERQPFDLGPTGRYLAGG